MDNGLGWVPSVPSLGVPFEHAYFALPPRSVLANIHTIMRHRIQEKQVRGVRPC